MLSLSLAARKVPSKSTSALKAKVCVPTHCDCTLSKGNQSPMHTEEERGGEERKGKGRGTGGRGRWRCDAFNI